MQDSRFSGDVIESVSNKNVKMIRSLQRRKGRLQERAFVVEGVRAVEDVVKAGIDPLGIYIRDDFAPEVIPFVENVRIHVLAAKVFNELTDVAHPQGILAIVPLLAERPVPVPGSVSSPLLLIVDGVRDPGNMGTLLRSAAGAGVDHVVIGPESVDPYHPRAVRAAMGAHVRIPFSRRDWDDLAGILRGYETIALADAFGDVVYDRIPWTMSSALIVGGEAFGASSTARQFANQRVSIPLEGGLESLNAGVAGSLLLFEAARQRRAAASPCV